MTALSAQDLERLGLFQGAEHQPFHFDAGRAGALLLHGFPGTPAETRALGEQFAQMGISAHGMLLPGFGADIPRLSSVTRADWVNAALEKWRALRTAHAPAILVGYSMGGAVALHLAAQLPPDQLVLFAPFAGVRHVLASLLPVVKHAVREIQPFARADFSKPATRAMIASVLPDANLDDAAVQHALKHQVRVSTQTLHELQLLGTRAYQIAPQVRAPALIVQGVQDKAVPPLATRQLLLRLGSPVTYCELNGTHDLIRLQDESAAAVVQAVRAFVKTSAQ